VNEVNKRESGEAKKRETSRYLTRNEVSGTPLKTGGSKGKKKKRRERER
jgi:hypothetical protein